MKMLLLLLCAAFCGCQPTAGDYVQNVPMGYPAVCREGTTLSMEKYGKTMYVVCRDPTNSPACVKP